MRSSHWRCAAWLSAACLTAACGDGGTEPPPPVGGPPVSRLVLSASDTTADVEDDLVVPISAFDSAGAVLAGRQFTVSSTRADIASAGLLRNGASAQVAVAANALGTAQITVTAPNTGLGAPVSQTLQVHVRPRIVLLDLPAGFTYTEVFGVNEAREVVGQAGSPPRAWAYSPARGTRLLPVLSQTQWVSQGRGVNPAGVIVGYSEDDHSGTHLVFWDAQDRLSDKGVLGYSLSIGTAIDASGQVALYRDVTIPSYSDNAAMFDVDGSVIALGDLGGNYSLPTGIADDGTIVGGSRDGTGLLRAFLWTRSGGMVGFAPINTDHGALGVASGRRVVGWFLTGVAQNTPPHGFYWSPADGWNDILPLGGYTEGSAAGIDESGQVIGTSSGPPGSHAFLWTKTGGLLDLGAGLSSSSIASAISPGGIVAGTVAVGPGSNRPVLWITRRLPH